MSLIHKWSPFGTGRWDLSKEADEMQERIGRALGYQPVRTNGGKEYLFVSEWAPLVDITEDDKEFLIMAELPEVKREDVKVSVDNGVLTITGERKYDHEEKSKKRHRVERSYGRFERSFTLPDDTDGTNVSAGFKDGVLRVHLPKSPNAKPKSVEIKVN